MYKRHSACYWTLEYNIRLSFDLFLEEFSVMAISTQVVFSQKDVSKHQTRNLEFTYNFIVAQFSF